MAKKTQNAKNVDWSDKIIGWARTDIGKKELSNSNENSSSAIKELKEALELNNDMLKMVFDI